MLSTISLVMALVAAPADGKQVTVAVVPLGTSGEMEPGAPQVYQRSLEDGLATGGVELVAGDKAASAGPRCETADCWRTLAGKLGVRFVVAASVQTQDRVSKLELELVDGSDGSVAARYEEVCEICGMDEVSSVIRDLTAGVRTKLRALTSPATWSIQTTPPGASVTVDGKDVGTTPLTIEVVPGSHIVAVAAKGREPQSRKLDAVGGSEEAIAFTLATRSDDPGAAEKSRRKVFVGVGATSLAVGLAMIGGGIPLIVIDDDQITSDCDGGNVDANGTCKFSHDTLAGGVALSVIGVALAATGTGLLIAARRKKRSQRRAQIVPSFGGFVVAGRF